MSRSIRPAAAPWLAVVVVLAVGCASPASPAPTTSPSVPPSGAPPSALAPSPGSSADPTTVYAGIAAQVEQIRRLQPKADVAPVVIDEGTLRANLTADFDHDNPPAQIQASETILITLGLLPPGTSLRDAYLDLVSGQVIGYYSPEHDQLFVVSRSGSIGPSQRVTYAHEFTHQLQDQNFDLSSLALDAPDQGDRSLARLALVEGDAVTTQIAWMTSHLTPDELGQVLADASDPEAAAALARAPELLRTTSLFPYTEGFAFVGRLMAAGGTDAVDAAFADPPDSTEQVLHPDKYLARERPVVVPLPSDLGLALGAGWTGTAQDTLGELLLRTWLTSSGVPATQATTAAAGWAGDRIDLLTGPHGEVALALVTRWDSATDAAEFATAARAAIHASVGQARVTTTSGSKSVSIAIAPSAATVQALSSALRP